MTRLPRSVAVRLAVVLLVVLLTTYAVFFALWRAQLNKVLVPELAQKIGSLIAECRQPLARLGDDDKAQWLGRFNARDQASLAVTSEEPTSESSLPFMRNLETQLRKDWGDDIRLRGTAGRRPNLKVTFRIAGKVYELDVPFNGINGPARPFVWLFISLGLVLWIAVIFIVAQVNRPLQRLAETLARSSDQLSKIDMPRTAPAEFHAFAEHFNALAGRLAAQERERRLLLAGVSHDLRAPLTRIRLRAELLDDVDASAALVRDADAMRRIVDQFLDYQREAPAFADSPADLVALVREVVARYTDAGHRITLAAPGSLSSDVDPLSMDRMLTNLIDNALAHGAEPVEISLISDGTQVRLDVRDYGTGVAEADLPRVVEPFERIDGARSAQGHCGLGLAIVLKLAGQIGGHFEIANAPGGGLLARIRLPHGSASNPR